MWMLFVISVCVSQFDICGFSQSDIDELLRKYFWSVCLCNCDICLFTHSISIFLLWDVCMCHCYLLCMTHYLRNPMCFNILNFHVIIHKLIDFFRQIFQLLFFEKMKWKLSWSRTFCLIVVILIVEKIFLSSYNANVFMLPVYMACCTLI